MGEYQKRDEAKIQKAIQGYLFSEGGYVFKVHGDMFTRAGVPDLICCYKGHFFGIEVKDKGNKPSELQLAHGRMIVKAGGSFLVAYSVDDVKKLIESWK